MAMTSGGQGGLSHDINVTPLIDVLLVLLIIFMVIVPVTPYGLDSLVPQPPKDKTQQVDQRLVEVQIFSRPGGEPTYKINEDDVAFADLYNRLQAIYAIRAEKVMFVKADDDVYYEKVAQVIDLAHKAGVDNIGLITPKVEAGQ